MKSSRLLPLLIAISLFTLLFLAAATGSEALWAASAQNLQDTLAAPTLDDLPEDGTHGQANPDDGLLHIHGKVLSTNTRLENLSVQLLTANGQIAAREILADNGLFQFQPVPRGSYQIQVIAEALGVLPLTVDSHTAVRGQKPVEEVQIQIDEVAWQSLQSATSEENRSFTHEQRATQADNSQSAPQSGQSAVFLPLVVGAEQGTVDAVASDQPAAANTGAITGVVTAEDGGSSMRYVQVFAYNSITATYDSNHTTADFNGKYTLNNLAAGKWYLEFRPYFGGDGYLGEFYNNKSTLATATAVTVGDTTVPNINAQLSRGGSIKGVVNASNTGLPLSSARIEVYTSTTSLQYIAYEYTDFNGSYLIQGLETGSYYLYVSETSGIHADEYYNNKRTLAAADAIAVARNVTTTIDLALDRGGVITGMISDVLTGKPLQYALVTLYKDRSFSSKFKSDYTDAAGQYSFAGLTPGDYYLAGQRSGYLDEYYNNKRTLADADSIAVSINVTRSDLNIAMDVGGTISGTVTDALTGQPVQSVSVRAYTSTFAAGNSYVASGYTDANGHYVVNNLPSGTYYLQFIPDGYTAFVEEFYNNKRSLATAEGISVALNSVTANRNVALDRGGVIVGKISNAATGAGLTDGSVAVYTTTTGYSIATFSVDTSGRYTTSAFPPGNYYLGFWGFDDSYKNEYYNNKPTQSTADAIALSLNTTTTIDAALDVLGAIYGRVTDEKSGAGASNVQVKLYQAITDTSSYQDVMVDSAGYYSLTGLAAGNYYLKFDSFNPNYVGEYYDNKVKRSESTAVAVALNNKVTINAALTRTGRIAGQVTSSANGAPLATVEVIAYGPPEELVNSCGDPQFYTLSMGRDLTDSNGNYEITGLPPGAYRLEFYTDNSQSSAYTRRHFGKSQSPVAVISDSVTTVNAALTLGAQISGQVTGEDTGSGLNNVYVYLYRQISLSTGQVGYSYQGYIETDTEGNYTSRGLSPGTYFVDFDPSYYGKSNKYVEEYYNDKLKIANADPIVLAASQAISNINAVLAIGGQITGVVSSGVNGKPLYDIFVSAYGINNFGYNYTYSDASGVYTLTGLTADSYRVEFEDYRYSEQPYAYEYYNDKSIQKQADGVAVQLRQTTPDINASLSPGGSINGVVVAADSGKPLRVRVYAIDADGYYERNIESDSNTGEYSLKGLPNGKYKVRFYGTSTSQNCQSLTYIGLYYNQKLDEATADPVNVVAPNAVNNINAALPLSGTVVLPVPAPGEIAGTVVNTASQPIANIHVAVYRLQSSTWQIVGSANTDSTGRYQVSGLSPNNDYRVHFSDPSQQYAAKIANNANALYEGDAIAVALGHTTAVNITLSRTVPARIAVTSDSATTLTDPQNGQVTIRVPRTSRKSVTITRQASCANGATPSNVTLLMEQFGSLLHEYPMTLVSGDSYQATIPESDLVNNATLKVRVTCASAVETEVGIIVLYDPSGIVSDAITGNPIANATVTLYRVPGWRARTSPGDTADNTCESNSSKPENAAWSQVAPTQLGTQLSTLTDSISPALNPQSTTATGYYGWDVTSGCWYVVVSATGYAPKVSPVVGVPPAVTDLNITLEKGKSVFLPLVAR